MVQPFGESRLWLTAGWTMLHFLWAGGMIGLVAALGCRALRSARCQVRYAFALGCLAGLVVAPVVIATTVVPSAATSKAFTFAETAVPGKASLLHIITPQDEAFLHDGASLASESYSSSGQRVPFDWARQNPLLRRMVILQTLAGLLPWLWIIGAPLVFAMTASGMIGAERLRRGSTLLDRGPVKDCLERLLDTLDMTKRVAVGACDRLGSPVLVGILRPVILLPAAAVSGWSIEQIEMVLLHELAHLRRWDNLVNFLQRVIESLLFFHPAVWLVSRWVRIEREHCCDQAVLAHTHRPRAYAHMLATMACPELNAAGRVAAAMGERNLVERIRRVLGSQGPTIRLSRSMLVVTGLALIVFALFVGAQARQPRANLPFDEFAMDIPATQLVSGGTQPENAVRGSGTLLLRAVDDLGRPVADAQVGFKIRWKRGLPEFQGAGAAPMTLLTDERGHASIPAGEIRQAKGILPVFVFDAARWRGGVARLAPSDIEQGVTVLLQPLCRVRAPTGCAQLQALDVPLTFIKAHVRLPVSPWPILCQQTFQPDTSASGPHEVEFPLPPGEYEWYTFAEGAGGETTQHISMRFEVQPGQSELRLDSHGHINLPLRSYSRKLPQPTLNFTPPRSLEDDSEIRLEDFRGKVVLLAFLGDSPRLQSCASLQQYHAAYWQYGLEVIAVGSEQAVQSGNSLSSAESSFVAAVDAGGPTPIPGTDWIAPGPIAAAYGVEYAGQILLIDREGLLAVGIDPWQVGGVAPEIERLLGLRSKSAAVPANHLLLKMVDPAGQPVSGAQVGTLSSHSPSADGRSGFWSPPVEPGGSEGFIGTSDSHGRVLVADTLLNLGLGGRGYVPLHANDPSRRLGALIAVSKEDLRCELQVTLQPLCRVHGQTPDTNATVSVEWDGLSLPMIDQTGEARQFEFALPGGLYRLRLKDGACRTAAVPAGASEVCVNF